MSVPLPAAPPAPATASAPAAAVAGPPRPATPPAVPATTRAASWRALVDLAAVALMLGAALHGFGPVFGNWSWVLPAGGGLLLGLLVAWVGALRRWGAALVAAATFGVYLVCGGALAVADTTVAGVVPTLATLQTLATQLVEAWAKFVTATPPVASFPALGVVPYVTGLVAGVVTASLALRLRRPAWALVPATLTLSVVILLGLASPASPVIQGVVFAVTAVVWLGWRFHDERAVPQAIHVHLRANRAATAAAMVALACGIAAVATPSVVAAATGRTVLRDQVVPPLILENYASPLVGYRSYVRDVADEPVLKVRGLPQGARVRLAVMDAYDGSVYNVGAGASGNSGRYDRVGTRIGTTEPADPVDVTITVEDYRGVWVPEVGDVSAVSFGGPNADDLAAGLYYNSQTQSALTTAGLVQGDSYTLTVSYTQPYTPAQLAGKAFAPVTQPALSRVPDAVAARGSEFVGEVTAPIEQVENLQAGLQEGYFSHGLPDQAPSRPGHSAERINELLTAAQMIGDDEQYAVAMALMARQTGMPARVVMGLYPDPNAPQDPGGTYTLTGADMHAWVEICFEGAGWVAFDAAPPPDRIPQAEAPRAQQEPKPQVLQPPPQVEEPDDVTAEALPDTADQEDKDEQAGRNWAAVVRVASAVAVPLLVLASPFIAIAALKTRRRSRRRGAPQVADRISGGWRELVDQARDLGVRVPPTATRSEAARTISTALAVAAPVQLASRADAQVFGPQDPDQAQAHSYWSEVEGAVAQMRRSQKVRTRLRARFSIRSLGRGKDR